ncbi:unnamed protein product [Notodromas monacha]|uniref:C2H2-type domain-containing protein n=1 Tax=Notodromas monacha TaxID=399045 RepID=A0A7R9BEA6_9CRUS|nr:unnamed protein product [Notodromas monacha]CAG0912871.1 unnamed protein product [Notodromas monacha]
MPESRAMLETCISRWLESKTAEITFVPPRTSSMLCQSCVDLVTKIDHLETQLDIALNDFVMLVAKREMMIANVKIEAPEEEPVLDSAPGVLVEADEEDDDEEEEEPEPEPEPEPPKKTRLKRRVTRAPVKKRVTRKPKVERDSEEWDETEAPPPKEKKAPSSPKPRRSYKAPLLCTICGKTFETRRAMYSHKVVHKEPGECHICGKRYKVLSHHMDVVHYQTKKFPCPLCEDSFTTRDKLQDHKCKVHGLPHPYICEECGRTFSTKTKLILHSGSHSGSTCPICNKVIKGYGNIWLRDHIDAVHKNKKKFACGVCEEKFSNRAQVVIHRAKVHAIDVDKIQHPCPECGKIFNFKILLRNHRYKEHNVSMDNLKILPCGFCNKEFFSNYKLQRHLLTHDGIKSHACPDCDYRSTMFYPVKTHMKTVHNRNVKRVFPNGNNSNDLDYVIVDITDEDNNANNQPNEDNQGESSQHSMKMENTSFKPTSPMQSPDMLHDMSMRMGTSGL